MAGVVGPGLSGLGGGLVGGLLAKGAGGSLLASGGKGGLSGLFSKLFGGGGAGAADAGATDAAAASAGSGLAGGLATGGMAVGGSFLEHWLQSAVAKAGPIGKFLSEASKAVGKGTSNPIQSLSSTASKDLLNLGKKTLNIGGGAGISVGGGGVTPGGKQGGSGGSTMSSGVSSQVKTAVKDAEAQVGKPYVWGGDSPATSLDCSGLVEWAYKQAGVSLPRTSQQQWGALQKKSVPLNKVQ